MDGYIGEAAISCSIEHIGDIITEEIKIISGVKEEANNLKTQVRDLQGYLSAADARADHDDAIRYWLKDTVNVVYQAENVLESLAYEKLIESRDFSQGNNIFGCLISIIQELVRRHHVGWEIKYLETKLSHRVERPKDLNISPLEIFRYIPIQRPIEYPELTDNDVGLVGIEESMEKILRKLAGEEEDLHRVVAIYGMGGLGKTTLARQIFNHPKVRSKFKCFAWVCAGQNYQPIDLMRKIVKSLTHENIDGMQLDELVSMLHKVQKTMKCLIVIDDMWNIDSMFGCMNRF